MTAINTPNCIGTIKNTGNSNCKVYPKHFKGAILVPTGSTYTEAECADFKAKIKPLFYASQSLRCYPIVTFTGFKDSTKEETKAAYGYGKEVYLKRKEYLWEFDTANGVAFANRLRSFNNSDAFDVLFFDEDGQIIGTLYDNAGANELKGFSLDYIRTMDNMASDGTKPNVNTTVFALSDPAEFNENLAILAPDKANLTIADLKGMIDLNITATGGVLKASISIKTVDDAINLYSAYSTEFAALTNFIVKKAGVVKTVGTSANDLVAIAKNNLTLMWDISFFAGSSGVFTFELDLPATLAAAGIGGSPANYYEGVNIASTTISAT